MNCKLVVHVIGIFCCLVSVSTEELFIETIEKGFFERGNVHCIAMILSDKVEFDSILNGMKIPYIISSLSTNEKIEVASHICKRHIFILRYNVKRLENFLYNDVKSTIFFI